jgi:Uma2 family endonuclease
MAKLVTPEYELDLVFPPLENMTDEEFFHFCNQNKHLKIERTASGQIIFMPPEGIATAQTNFNIGLELGFWNKQTKAGYAFGTSAGFTMPDGSVLSPDLAWISKSRYDALDEGEKSKFARIVPEFVVELLSPTESLKVGKKKMEAWRDNGVCLGWLIVPKQKQAFIYRANGTTDLITDFVNGVLSGEDVLPEFQLPLKLTV